MIIMITYLQEFPRLFNIEGNFLKKLKPHGRFSAVDFDNIIKHYDRDGNGTIDAGKLMAPSIVMVTSIDYHHEH